MVQLPYAEIRKSRVGRPTQTEGMANNRDIKDFSGTHLADRDRTPAGKATCQECPFRESNRGRENPFDHYQNYNLTRYWREVSQDGDFFTCHMFGVDAYAFDESARAQGFKAPVNIGHARECAGTVAMLRRELDILRGYSSWGDYKRDRPTGISEKTYRRLQERISGDARPALTFSDFVSPDDVIHPEDWIDTSSNQWMFSKNAAANLLNAMSVLFPETNECDCPTCRNHSQVHPMKELKTADGQLVEVDAAMFPLLNSLARAGIETTESCINLPEAVEALAPGEVGSLTNMAAGTINYRQVMLRRDPFIRLSNVSPVAQAFILAASQTPGVAIDTDGGLTQLVYRRKAAGRLLRIAQVLAAAAKR
jgi:hypothetical protein